MISRSLRSSLAKRSLVNTQMRFAGGGPKKPAMPADQTDFDVLLVGK